MATFDHVPEMADRHVNCIEFPDVCGVILLCWAGMLAKEAQGFPPVACLQELFLHGTDCYVGRTYCL